MQTSLNENWVFTKKNSETFRSTDISAADAVPVNIPHTWNALDGQDGGNDYYRGACWYQKRMDLPEITDSEELYLQFGAINSIADVYINGEKLGSHAGGYSAFRFPVTPWSGQKKVLISVCADNSDRPDVYPRTADYTFFGGIYRSVTLLKVPKTHFSLGLYGSYGVFIDTEATEEKAQIFLRSCVENPVPGMRIHWDLLDQDSSCAARGEWNWNELCASPQETCSCVGSMEAFGENSSLAVLTLARPHLWNGRRDPYLYTAAGTLSDSDGTVLDRIEIPFGIRSYSVNSTDGFYLNGASYPLHGVSRHQDRKDHGWAIGRQEHEEDMAMICEIGATSIRLAHYQHDSYFYDLCDKNGLVVWAEIPFISQMSAAPGATENLISQMSELILQNYNHPSICFWGLENETTIQNTGSSEEDTALVAEVERLQNLCKTLNPARLTTQACLGNVNPGGRLASVSDLVSFNHYFGWYVGETENLGKWLDAAHEKQPELCIGISEYGGDGSIRFHNDHPHANDYSEDFQAILHEESEAVFSRRPYVWSHYVWNMFDFGSDRRDEGGAPGLNQKGLVTYDRKVKKDAFYLYKAYWSDEPFVHICGHHYKNRTAKVREIKVYSNQPQVTLLLNGETVECIRADRIFRFEINLPLGENTLTALSGDIREELQIIGTETYDTSYKIKEPEGKAGIVNWFENADDFHFTAGTFSVNDRVSDIMETPKGQEVLEHYFSPYIDVQMMAMAKNFKLAKIISKFGKAFPAELAVEVNDALGKIPKPEDD